MKKAKPARNAGHLRPVPSTPSLTEIQEIRYGGKAAAIPAVPCTIHTPVDGGVVMADRAYVMIHVAQGVTSQVVRALAEIKQIKTIDPCWGKPDIIVVVEVPDQDALTQLVLSRIHAIEGVTQTDTHLVYQLKTAKAK